MKKITFLLLGLLTLNFSLSQDTWVQKDSVNGPPRSNCASFVLNGEGWIVGGLDIVEFKRKMYSYDVDQDDWDNETSLGGVNGAGLNRGGAIAFSALGKGFVGLGQGNNVPYFNDLWEFDPLTNAWTQKATFTGSARRHAVCFEINNIAYVGTGQDATGFLKDFYKYEAATNTWTQISDFGGSPRKGAVGFTMSGQGYVGTGDEGILVNDFWQYQPITDTWIEKAAFPGTARSGAVGWGIFPTAFIACGYDNSFNYKKDVWEYNYFADVWTQRSNLAGPKRTSATAFVIDGIAYLGMGYNGYYLDDFYAYTPILNTESYNDVKTTVYPNPATNYINFDFLNYKLPLNVNVNVFNISGKQVKQIDYQNSNSKITLNVKNLARGHYIINIKTPNSTFNYTSKFTVQ